MSRIGRVMSVLGLDRALAGKRSAAMARVQWVLGVCVTAVVTLLWWQGALERLELGTMDLRARHVPSSNAVVSDRVMIVAIDDAALDNVGRWPWDRVKLAAVIDELRLAGVSVVALDLLLDEPQQARYVPGFTLPGEGSRVEVVRDDAALGEAIRRHGRVVTAVSFPFATSVEAPAALAAGEERAARATMTELYALMAGTPAIACEPWEKVGDRVRAGLPAFAGVTATRGIDLDKLRLKWEAAVALATRATDSSLDPGAGGGAAGAPWALSLEPGVPIAPIADASKRLANVTFDSYDPDGQTRRIPLLVMHNGRLWPTLGMAAAAEYLGATPAKWRLDQERVGVQGATEERSLHWVVQRIEGRPVAGVHLVSWPRGVSGGGIPYSDWRRQFYVPGGRSGEGDRDGEVPIGRVYEPARLSIAVKDNWLSVVKAFEGALRPMGLLDGAPGEAWAAVRARGDTAATSEQWRGVIEGVRGVFARIDGDARTLVELATGDTPLASLPEPDRTAVANLIDARTSVPANLGAMEGGVARVDERRAKLRGTLSGTICFVGWTATGSLADFVATSIDPRTPGVHVHAAVCNSLLSGFERRPGPLWGQALVVVALGLIGTWVGVRSTVVGGPLLVAGVIALWAGFAGFVLWGLYDSVWAVVGPAVAASAGWLVVVLHRLLVEQRSRRKTEERFKSYVSPAVVDILVENPQLNSMAPQRRELTVLFTDIAGFTTTAERIGSEATARLLGTLLGTMTDVIQRHGATLDKYIGDAIMAFWGAPIDDAAHARHGCSAAVEMMTTLDRLNAEGAFGEAGLLHMRIGLATGELMVGDFGNPPRNSSYTVIGDTANLGSRLEGANKAFGTRTLVSARTRALAGEGFVWRSVGKIRVKGKVQGIEVFELLPGMVKGDATAGWIALTEAMVADYQAERFDAAIAKCLELQQTYHDEGVATAYGEAIAAFRAGLIEGEFEGSITLTDK